MDPNLKHRLSSVANPNADYYRPDETRLAKDALAEIDHLERERGELRVKVEAARKILEPMADCDPDIREWLGLPRFGDALRSPEDK